MRQLGAAGTGRAEHRRARGITSAPLGLGPQPAEGGGSAPPAKPLPVGLDILRLAGDPTDHPRFPYRMVLEGSPGDVAPLSPVGAGDGPPTVTTVETGSGPRQPRLGHARRTLLSREPSLSAGCEVFTSRCENKANAIRLPRFAIPADSVRRTLPSPVLGPRDGARLGWADGKGQGVSRRSVGAGSRKGAVVAYPREEVRAAVDRYHELRRRIDAGEEADGLRGAGRFLHRRRRLRRRRLGTDRGQGGHRPLVGGLDGRDWATGSSRSSSPPSRGTTSWSSGPRSCRWPSRTARLTGSRATPG